MSDNSTNVNRDSQPAQNEELGNRFRNTDLKDSDRDKERLRSDEATIDLPDVSDIPGQEHVHVPPLGELADTTISSGDEEGEGLFVDDEDDETRINMGSENDVSRREKELLEKTDEFLPTDDAIQLRNASLDTRDNEGDRLNESAGFSGSDLDVPGAGMDDRDEEAGAEDEENNQYSLGSDDNEDTAGRDQG